MIQQKDRAPVARADAVALPVGEFHDAGGIERISGHRLQLRDNPLRVRLG